MDDFTPQDIEQLTVWMTIFHNVILVLPCLLVGLYYVWKPLGRRKRLRSRSASVLQFAPRTEKSLGRQKQRVA